MSRFYWMAAALIAPFLFLFTPELSATVSTKIITNRPGQIVVPGSTVILPVFEWQYVPQPVGLPVAAPPPIQIVDPNTVRKMVTVNDTALPAVVGVRTIPAVNIAAKATEILRSSCSVCHSQPKAKAGFEIFKQDGQLNPHFDKEIAWEQIVTNRMPPTAPNNVAVRLSQADKDILREWLRNGRL